MLEIWVGLTNANRREIDVIERAFATFEFAYLNSESFGNPVFRNVEIIHFSFPKGWAGPFVSNWIKGALFSAEQDGYSFFDSPLKITGLVPEASGINFDIGELCFELIGIPVKERNVYVKLENELIAISEPIKPIATGSIDAEIADIVTDHQKAEAKKSAFKLDYNVGYSAVDQLIESAVDCCYTVDAQLAGNFSKFLEMVQTQTKKMLVKLNGGFGTSSPKSKLVVMRFAQALADKIGPDFKVSYYTKNQTRTQVFKTITEVAAEFGLDVPMSSYVTNNGLQVVLASTPGPPGDELLEKVNANPPPPVIVSKVEPEDTKYVCDKCFTNYCDCESPAFITLEMAKQKKKEKKEANAKAAAKHAIMVDNGEKIIKQIKKDFAAATEDKDIKSFDDIKGEVSTVFEAANDLGIMLDTALLTWLDDNLKFK